MFIITPLELDKATFEGINPLQLKYLIYAKGYEDVVLGLLADKELVVFTELDISVLTNAYFLNRPLTEVNALEYNDFYDEHMADFIDYVNKVYNRKSLRYLEEFAEVAYTHYDARFIKPDKPKSLLRRLYEKLIKKAV